MYLPAAFVMDDRRTLLAHARANPFATVVTHGLVGESDDDANGVQVSHLPLLVDEDRGVLRGHLARDNPQFRHIAAGGEALAIFHGPHGYVSPSVYAQHAQHASVPTWNYVVVHARGRARLVDEAGLRSILDDTVARFDSTGWRFDAPDDYVRRMLDAIAGFEVTLERLEGKWKLSQNRPPEDQERVADWLDRGDDASRAVAALMRARSRE